MTSSNTKYINAADRALESDGVHLEGDDVHDLILSLETGVECMHISLINLRAINSSPESIKEAALHTMVKRINTAQRVLDRVASKV